MAKFSVKIIRITMTDTLFMAPKNSSLELWLLYLSSFPGQVLQNHQCHLNPGTANHREMGPYGGRSELSLGVPYSSCSRGLPYPRLVEYQFIRAQPKKHYCQYCTNIVPILPRFQANKRPYGLLHKGGFCVPIAVFLCIGINLSLWFCDLRYEIGINE